MPAGDGGKLAMISLTEIRKVTDVDPQHVGVLIDGVTALDREVRISGSVQMGLGRMGLRRPDCGSSRDR